MILILNFKKYIFSGYIIYHLRLTMDTELGCYLCKTPGASMHCDICNNPLCKTCVGEHLSDETKEHKLCQLESGDLPLFVNNIYQNYVNFTVKNAKFLSVQSVLPPGITKLIN